MQRTQKPQKLAKAAEELIKDFFAAFA